MSSGYVPVGKARIDKETEIPIVERTPVAPAFADFVVNCTVRADGIVVLELGAVEMGEGIEQISMAARLRLPQQTIELAAKMIADQRGAMAPPPPEKVN